MSALGQYAGDYDVSAPALRTAQRDTDGRPVGVNAYDEAEDAIRAGDMAAFLTMLQLQGLRTGHTSPYAAVVLSLDTAAGGEIAAAREVLRPALELMPTSQLAGFLDAWYLALDGQDDAAISAHRQLSRRLPGLTANLSLAAMLEGLGRFDDALAVYAAMTPTDIIAPQHDFDPQNLVFSHVRLVIARHALLLRRRGEVEQAQALYQRLADAEPEQAVGYASAMEALETGRGLDEDELDLRTGFARSLQDYTLAISYQSLFDAAASGRRLRGYDSWKGGLDQLALLLAPDRDALRLNVYRDLYDEAHFDGALNVLRAAPRSSAELKIAEASTLLRLDQPDAAKAAVDAALAQSEPDDALSVTSAAMRLYALLNERTEALRLAAALPDLATGDAEEAVAHSMSASVYTQFGVFAEALDHARSAQALDDTHDRRMVLADALANAGEIDEGLSLLRNEVLGRPNDPYMLNTLGYYLVSHTDRFDEAFRVLARAVALAPNDGYIADSFGWVRYQLGDLEGARFYIERSRRELAPNRNWEIEDHLGDIYWHLELLDDARAAWRNALAEFPPDEARAQIEDKLAHGLQDPPPARQPLPDVSLSDDGEINRQDI